MMSHLCSAGIGRNILRSSKKAPKEAPKVTTSNDEIYGFLPNHRWSTRSLTLATKSPSPSTRSCQSQHIYEVPKFDLTFQNSCLDTSGHSSGYSSQGSPNSSHLSSPKYAKNETGSCASQSTSTSSQYPRTLKDTHKVLDKSNKNVVANIPMVVSRDYKPPAYWTGKPEVSVRLGMVVNALYKVSEWIRVKTPDNRDGFIPSKCLTIISAHRSTNFTQQFPEETNLNDTGTSGHGSMTSLASLPALLPRGSRRRSSRPKNKSPERTFLSEHEISIIKDMAPRQRSPLILLPSDELTVMTSSSSTISDGDETWSVTSSLFSRSEGPELSVLFDYKARQEGDISVKKQQTVFMLNDDDPDWIWVQTKQGKEGFIPKSYAANLKALHLDPNVKTTYF